MCCLNCSFATLVTSQEAALAADAADDHHRLSVAVMVSYFKLWSFYKKNCHLPPEKHLCLNCSKAVDPLGSGGPSATTSLHLSPRSPPGSESILVGLLEALIVDPQHFLLSFAGIPGLELGATIMLALFELQLESKQKTPF